MMPKRSDVDAEAGDGADSKRQARAAGAGAAPHQAAAPLPFESHFVLRGEVGSGSFGKVFLCEPTELGKAFLRNSGLVDPAGELPRLVVKQPQRVLDVASAALNEKDSRRELEALKRWHHRGIVRFFGDFAGSDGKRHLVLEAMGGVGDGPLAHVLSDRDRAEASAGDFWRYIHTRERMPDGEFRLLAFQLLSAVAYLHRQGVAHRDLKPENFLCGPPLVKTSHGPVPTVKLSDFGSARELSVVDQFGLRLRRQATTVAVVAGGLRWKGSAQFIAPELFRAAEDDREAYTNERESKASGRSSSDSSSAKKFSGAYTEACDIFSLGVSFYAMLTKLTPYSPSVPAEDIMDGVMLGGTELKCRRGLASFGPGIARETQSFVLSMLSTDPAVRPSADALLQDTFFDAIRDEARRLFGDERP